MWIVLKYKSNELQNLKYDFKNKLGEMPIFFQPKVKYQKYSKNKYISFSKKRIEPRWQIGFVSLSHQQRPKFFRKRNSMQIQCGVFFQYDF